MSAVYAYIRFSTDRQSDGDSVGRQSQAINAYCAANGLTVGEWIRDLGKSAFTGSNRRTGELAKFITRVTAGEIAAGSTLIVESVDRLSREDVMSALDSYTALINAGLTIVTTMDGKALNRANYNDQWTNMVVTLSKMAVANEESAKKSVRSLSAWEKRRQNPDTMDVAPNRPSWIDEDRNLIPERTVIIERMFREVLDGHGFAKIAKRLNEDKIATWGQRKKSQPFWRDGTIYQIVRGHTVIGDFQPQKKGPNGKKVDAGPLIEGYYQPAIDAATYHRAQAVLDSRSFNSDRGRKGRDFTNLFTKLAKCAHCGAAMVLRSGQGVKYLTCSGAKRGNCDNKVGTEYSGFERAVLEKITDFDVGHQKPDTTKLVNEIAETAHQIERQRNRIDAIVEQLLEMKSETLRAKLAEGEAALVDLETKRKTFKAELTRINAAPSSVSRQDEIRNLIADMADPSKDAYAIRSRLNAAIRDIIDHLMFSRNRYVEVSVLNMLSFYTFRATGSIKHAQWEVRAVRATADFEGVETLAEGDDERLAKMKKVLANR